MRRFAQLEGLVDWAPVILPTDKYAIGKNWFFGWPVAAQIENTIVVVFHRIPAHGDNYGTDKYTSRAVVVRSTDHGQTWSDPFDLRDVVKQPTTSCKLGFGNAIGTTKSGNFITVTGQGVFRSNDRGETWEHLGEAFGAKQLSGPGSNGGPRIVEHAELGLVVPMHTDSDGRIKNELWIRYSQDEGETWKEKKYDLPFWVKAVEPSALAVENGILILARSHGSYDAYLRTWSYAQLWSPDGVSPYEPTRTNILVADTMLWSQDGGNGPWAQDTPDVMINPLTRRIEAVTASRTGGGQGEEHLRTHSTLNMWSLDQKELQEGKADWLFEGTLARRNGTAVLRKMGVDGMHPGAATIDLKLRMQHIFVYMGFGSGPSGIFRISRSLRTPELYLKLKDVDAKIKEEEKADQKKKDEEVAKAVKEAATPHR